MIHSGTGPVIFPEALVRSLKNHVRGHMIDLISNRLPS